MNNCPHCSEHRHEVMNIRKRLDHASEDNRVMADRLTARIEELEEALRNVKPNVNFWLREKIDQVLESEVREGKRNSKRRDNNAPQHYKV